MKTVPQPLNDKVHHSSVDKPVEPSRIVVIGGSGDLAHRKLLPALYNLFREGRLGQKFFILGCSRSAWNDESFRREAAASLKKHGRPDATTLKKFLPHLYYRVADADNPASF